MEELKSCDYVVIGGGISGLLAAYLLRKLKKDVLLISPLDHIGGCIRSIAKDGYTLELGANTFSSNPYFDDLINELGLADAVRPPFISPFRQYVWHKDSMHELPKGPAALLKSSLFSATEKYRLITGLFKKKIYSEDVTVGDAFSSLFSRSIVEKVIDPALRGIFGGDVWKLRLKSIFSGLGTHLIEGGSLISYFKKLKKGRKVFCFFEGNSTLTKALFRKLQSEHIDDYAIDVSYEDEFKFKITTKTGLRILTKNVLIATSGGASATLVDKLSPGLGENLTLLKYAPVTSVHVSCLPSPVLPRGGFGVLFPSTSTAKIMGVLFNSQLFPHVAPSDRALVTVCLGGVHQPELTKLDDSAIEALVLSELNTRIPLIEPKVLSIHRWNAAIPQYEGQIGVLLESLQRAEKEFPGLHFIGVDTGGVGVPERIKLVSELVQNRFFPRSDI